MVTHRGLYLILLLSCATAAFAASSRLVVITPDNEAEHPFLVEVRPVADRRDRSRVRVIGAVGGDQRVWLIVCKNYVDAGRQRFRNVLWFGAESANIERFVQLFPEQHTVPQSARRSYPFFEVELSHEQMRRAYIYIDYPRPVDDGGAFYSIDLAYYLEGNLGRKRAIRWEAR